jgi:hypothetical protein
VGSIRRTVTKENANAPKSFGVVILDASIPSKRFYDSLGYVTLEETFLEVENNKRPDFYKMQKSLVAE